MPATLGAAGVTVSGGRIANETDRVVHLFPLPAGQTILDELVEVGGAVTRPGEAELVTLGTGVPCAACVVAAPGPETA